MDKSVIITIDAPVQDTLVFMLSTSEGVTLDTLKTSFHGPVDNILLTSIDNLLDRNSIHKFALKAVRPGQGIDKNSSLYRMVQSLAAAIIASDKRP